MATTLTHPALGTFTFKKSEKVVQLLGVQYATLKDRFAEPQLVEGREEDVTDATKLGPSVVQNPGTVHAEHAFIQKELPVEDNGISDLKGLTLNVTLPDQERKDLPVFLFIHGGGFVQGSCSYPHYDLAKFVQLSTEVGTPVIGISINYRLGAPGFLTSTELRELGYKSNNGLRDQRTALLWVKKHIAGFGGNPDEVTVMGESAGGAASMHHLHSKEPLYKRLITTGGTSLLVPLLPPPVADIMYQGVLASLEIKASTPEERLKGLLATPVADLYTKISPAIPLVPILDDITPSQLTFNQVASGTDLPPGFGWCQDLLIGDCQFDASIFSYLLPHLNGPNFLASINRTLASSSPKTLAAILSTYKLDPTLPEQELTTNVLRFANDISFYAPVPVLASAWNKAKQGSGSNGNGGKGYKFHFNIPNPWPGKWTGEATHILDVAYLFMNYEDSVDGKGKEQGKKFAKTVVEFVNGGKPFGKAGDGDGAMVFGPPATGDSECGFVAQSEGHEGLAAAAAVGRRGEIFELADVEGEKIGLDGLAGVWGAFMAGK